MAALEAGAVPLLLGRDISEEILEKLLVIYEPAYLFVPNIKNNLVIKLNIIKEFEEYLFCSYKDGVGPELNTELGLLLATSGSTGSPKLVRLSMSNIISNADAIIKYLSIDHNERAITTLPFNYSYGLSVINSHLRAGASIILTNRTFFEAAFWQSMKTFGVTSISGVPYTYEILLKLRFERMLLPNLKTLTQAGGGLAVSQKQRLIEICETKGMRFITMYGQTEASPRMAFLEHEFSKKKIGSIGQAIPGGRLWLEDENGKTIKSSGQIGELVYSGPNVALGYALNQDDLKNGDDWNGVLHTGDFARQDEEGFFFIEGRKQRFLKIFGVRVSLDAIESWYAEKNIVAAAHGYDDHLYISIESSIEGSNDAISKALADEMHIHLSALTIRKLSKLPRLKTGKLDYSCLNKTH